MFFSLSLSNTVHTHTVLNVHVQLGYLDGCEIAFDFYVQCLLIQIKVLCQITILNPVVDSCTDLRLFYSCR